MPVHQILNTNNIWTGTNTYNSYLPTSTLTPSLGTQLITKTYADSNFLDRINNLTQSINGVKMFSVFPQVSGFPTLSNELINKFFADGNCLDRTNNLTQSINGVTTFSNQTYSEGIVMRDGLIWQDICTQN